MYKELLAYKQTPERTAAILTDEASAVHKGMLYREVFPSELNWYTSNAKCEMGDLIVMARLLCEQNNWNMEELEQLGRERFLVRMEELRQGRQE